MSVQSLARSCEACIRSKKKCDKASPRCQRCAQRKVQCRYQNEPGQSLRPSLSHRTPPEPQMLLTLDSDSLNFMIESLKSFPILLGESKGHSWIHPQLYNIITAPSTVRTTHAILRQNLHELKSGHDLPPDSLETIISTALHALPSLTTFTDNLALVQTLITIQILTFFSPNSLNYTPKEAHDLSYRQNLLTHYAQKLWATAPVELPSHLTPMQSYIFAESVRRTMLMASELHAVYQILRTGVFVHNAFIAALPFCANTELWEKLGVGGLETGRGEDRVVDVELISFREYTDAWAEGRVRKVGGVFEKMLLVGCSGRRAVEERLQALRAEEGVLE